MTDADIEAIRSAITPSRFRVAAVATSVGRVIVKKQRPPRSRWRGRAVDALAAALGLAVLRAVPAHGGSRGQEIEIERLQSLRAAGVAVPEVLHIDRDFFVIGEFAGPDLVALIERGGAGAFEAWRRGLAMLTEVHARGGCLSHAAARNFIATDAGLGAIDFEDDPLEAMSLDAAQARDWLAYLHSTLWLLQRPAAELQAAVAIRLADEPAAVRAFVDGAGRRLSPLRYLPGSRRLWGREVAGARALGALFPLPVVAATTIDAAF